MPNWHRRSVLASGVTLTTGIGLAASGVGAQDDGTSTVDDLPDPAIQPNPDLDEDWASYRGGAGHTGYAPDGPEFDGDALGAAWSVESHGSVAVADETVYTSRNDGVVAIDAANGTIEWENTDANPGDPVVVGDSVYVAGDEGVVALDRSDGSDRWEHPVGANEHVSGHTVAYDAVYVVAGGTLYALETEDGSIRWERESVTVEHDDGEQIEYEFDRTPTAANGVVYAGSSHAILALEPQTGAEVWRNEKLYISTTSLIHANSNWLVLDGSGVEKAVHDPYTGEMDGMITFETGHALALDDEIYATGNHWAFYGGSIEGDEYDWSVSIAYNAGEPVISGDTVYVYFPTLENESDDYDEELVALDKYDGTEKWTLSKDDAPVGLVRAVSDDTLYVQHDGELVALREGADDEFERGGTVDRPADTRMSANQTGPSGVRIQVEEDLAGLELTISEQTSGVDTAEIADGLGNTLATADVSELSSGDTFQIEHDLAAGEEYIVLVSADDTYDRGDYDESPDWPYDGDEFQVLEGIWARDNSSSGNFYAYSRLTALLDADDGDGDGVVDRPADTRVTPTVSNASGVRIQVDEDLAGLELTISENTTGADTAEIADAAGNTLVTTAVSGLEPGDTFQIAHDLAAGEEYIVLIHADGAYDRGAYNEDPEWPYDAGSFQVLEGIWDRTNSSTNNFYAFTRVAALSEEDVDDTGGTVDRPADTRVTPTVSNPSGVRISVEEDLAGLELTISEQTSGVDTAEIADGLGNTLATSDVTGLGPGDTFEIEHDLAAGEEYIVLVSADGAYDRGDYDESPEWPYDGGEFQVLEGIWARDNSSSGNFYAYSRLTALLDADDDDDDATEGVVDRPADTRVSTNQTGPSGVRIQVQEDLAGLELTISEETSGVDTAEIADELGNTLATTDVSGLSSGDTVQIAHDLAAGEEYIVLVSTDDTYDRGAYNESPDWPYDAGSFQAVEGIWGRDNSSTNNFYAFTRLAALSEDEIDDTGGTVDRPADTRLSTNQTGPSGVRIEAQDDISGLELTLSEETSGVDTVEIADGLGNTLATTDVSGLGPGDTVRVEHDLVAGEEYIVLVSADDTYDRGAYNEGPDWPYDGGEFQVLEGIWGRDIGSTNNFYAFTRLTALL